MQDREGFRLFQATRGGICAGYIEDSRGEIVSIAPILRKYARFEGRTGRTLKIANFKVVRTHTFTNGRWTCVQSADLRR